MRWRFPEIFNSLDLATVASFIIHHWKSDIPCAPFYILQHLNFFPFFLMVLQCHKNLGYFSRKSSRLWMFKRGQNEDFSTPSDVFKFMGKLFIILTYYLLPTSFFPDSHSLFCFLARDSFRTNKRFFTFRSFKLTILEENPFPFHFTWLWVSGRESTYWSRKKIKA